nr:Grx4 family monothiol glutaredoxin [Buchnera aphidicola]
MIETIKIIKEQLKDNKIILYMKGSPLHPSCGFSAQAIQALNSCGICYAYIDILKFPKIRKYLPKYSNWPTFPQLWVNKELIGGCDIILEMLHNGELLKILKK